MAYPVRLRRRMLAVFSDDPKVRSDVAKKTDSAGLSAFKDDLRATDSLPERANDSAE